MSAPRRALPSLLLAGLLGGLLAGPLRAEEGRIVAVVVDRSGSLRHADPAGRGPRLLAAALALSLEPADRLLLLSGDGDPALEPAGDAAALAARLSALVAVASPQDGGADLAGLVSRAAEQAGEGGLVLVLTDDDLDVIGADGRAPLEVVERARRGDPRPARDALNRAALELLGERLRGLPGRRLLGLRAPLPPGARTVAFLEAVGARVLDLGGDEDQLLADLVEGLRGEPSLSQAAGLAAGAGLSLPGPSRVVLRGEAPLQLAGARALDPEGRLVLLESPGGELRVDAAARAWVAPRAPLPAGVRAFALRGAARVVLQGADPHAGAGELVLRWGTREARLEGSPPAAELPPASGPLHLLRVVRGPDGHRAVAARRELFPELVELELAASGPATAGLPLELSGAPPAELAWREPIPVRLRGPGGRAERVVLVPAEGRFGARFTPPLEGAWEAQAEGLLPVRLAAPLQVAAGARHTLRIEALTGPGGEALLELEPPEGPAALRLRVVAEPPLPAALPLRVVLEGAPAGALLALRGALELRDRAEADLDLTWPEGPDADAQVTLRVLGPEGTPLSASRGFVVHPRRGLLRRLAAGGALGLALVWALAVWIRRRRARALAAAQQGPVEEEPADEPAPRPLAVAPEVASRLGTRQLRGLGTNGKISVERYGFLEHSREDSSVVISPEDSSVQVELHVKADGTVKAKAAEGAKLIHEDRPQLLVNETTLRHGNAFAVVEGQQARRYVYLEREPDAETLQTRFIEGTVSNEAELHDSGMFVVLDDHHEVAPESARMVQVGPDLLGKSDDTIMPEEIEDSRDQIAVVPGDSQRASPVSDEGMVYLDSDESEILDSDDGVLEQAGTDHGPVGPDDPTGEAPPLPGSLSAPPAAPPLPAARPSAPPRAPSPPSRVSDVVIGGSESDAGPTRPPEGPPHP